MARRNRKRTQIEREASIRGAQGPNPAGQAGDLQGLSDVPLAESESVRELAEEGQAFEAAITQGVEKAADPDESEITVAEVPEDDVPSEYLEKDHDEPKE